MGQTKSPFGKSVWTQLVLHGAIAQAQRQNNTYENPIRFNRYIDILFLENLYIDEVLFVENESSWKNCSRHECYLLRALILVVDIEQNGKQQYDTFDYLLPVDSDSHNGHAIVQHADKKSPD